MPNPIPQFLKEKLLNQYGEELTNKIMDGYSQKRKVTFRVNTLKSDVHAVIEELTKQGLKHEQVAWNKEAFILENAIEKQIRELAMYENGEIYLQSLSSMLPAIVLEPKANENILDMTAAPRRKNNSNGSNI